ncbi:TetR/AcrR family transcriptional regulator [Nonomuraea africana]|uniref:TetR/AcrR family transcriptional regulator n=1 Tax=Nonomuraea africana TaxID=46171 RepID=UPI0033FCCEA9
MSDRSQRGKRGAAKAPEREDGRTARARVTKGRIIAAATELFTTAGYTGTSIGAIAAAAGVGEQTVYYAFGTKKAILAAALDQAVAGDDEPVPTLERAWVREALADPDPRSQIRRQIAGAGDIYLRAAALLDVVRSAATTDPDLAEIWATNIQQRLTVQRVFIEELTRKTPLAGGLTVGEATDVAVALLSPETYNLLVRDRGWEHSRWQEWAATAFTSLLTTLPAAPLPSSSPA